MQIVGALDVHRRQITTRTLDLESGELRRGGISPATREEVRAWFERFGGLDTHFAVEGTTGWRFVVEEIERAGQVAHLADPAEVAAKRGRKRRAKTDDADCELMLKLLLGGELPESWIPPRHVLELRTRVRLRKALVDERTALRACAGGLPCANGQALRRRAARRHSDPRRARRRAALRELRRRRAPQRARRNRVGVGPQARPGPPLA
jgi:hypothetical protein